MAGMFGGAMKAPPPAPVTPLPDPADYAAQSAAQRKAMLKQREGSTILTDDRSGRGTSSGVRAQTAGSGVGVNGAYSGTLLGT